MAGGITRNVVFFFGGRKQMAKETVKEVRITKVVTTNADGVRLEYTAQGGAKGQRALFGQLPDAVQKQVLEHLGGEAAPAKP